MPKRPPSHRKARKRKGEPYPLLALGSLPRAWGEFEEAGRVLNKEESAYFQKLGARIKSLREEKGLDQKAFAFECEIGRTQLHMIEKGKTNPRLLTLMKTAKGLEVSLGVLVDIAV